ncbi:hypothetical protein DFH09DRAFT_1314043 [Mycena vulgaris]|nr:hypothetical protein DFH09DRAFT_1314043 [Mycena vulgaris]
MNTTEYNVNSAGFDCYWRMMVFELCATCATLLLYGFYLNLFILAIYTLCRRKTRGKYVLIGASCAMALLGTTQAALRLGSTATIIGMSRELVHTALPPTSIRWITYNILTKAQNILYRCYVIWGAQWKVILLPGLLTLSTLVTAYVAIPWDGPMARFDGRTPYGMATFTNLVLLALTAGRILWMRREAFYAGLDDTCRTRYRSAVTIILESGAIYCVCAVLLTITFSIRPLTWSVAYGITLGTSLQAINIAPTLTVVRIGLGHNTDDPIDLKEAPAEGQLRYIL